MILGSINPYSGASSALDQITAGTLINANAQSNATAQVLNKRGNPNDILMDSVTGSALQGLGYNRYSYAIQQAKVLIKMMSEANKLVN